MGKLTMKLFGSSLLGQALATAGVGAGKRVADRLNPETMQRVFAALLVAVAVYTGAAPSSPANTGSSSRSTTGGCRRSLTRPRPDTRSSSASAANQAGGRGIARTC